MLDKYIFYIFVKSVQIKRCPGKSILLVTRYSLQVTFDQTTTTAIVEILTIRQKQLHRNSEHWLCLLASVAS